MLKLGLELGAKQFSVSNVLPVTPELQEEVLYARARNNLAYINSAAVPSLNLPKMDFDDVTRAALFEAFQAGYNISYAGHNWAGASNVCNYIEGGSMSVAWTGDVSPCWPLMHTHISYLHGKPRVNHRHVVGNVLDRSLRDLWLDQDYVAYRQRIQDFAFAPCTFCGGCELAEANQEDCLGNDGAGVRRLPVGAGGDPVPVSVQAEGTTDAAGQGRAGRRRDARGRPRDRGCVGRGGRDGLLHRPQRARPTGHRGTPRDDRGNRRAGIGTRRHRHPRAG